MAKRELIHASFVELNGYGVIIRGVSGSGKSDLTLRLLENKGARLVADDMVELEVVNNRLQGKAPANIAGLLEVRGIGLVKYPYLEEAMVDLLIELKNSPEDIERMPIKQKDVILGLAINKIDLYAKENSAPDKIVAALRYLFETSAD